MKGDLGTETGIIGQTGADKRMRIEIIALLVELIHDTRVSQPPHLLTFGANSSFCGGGCPVHLRKFSSIPGL